MFEMTEEEYEECEQAERQKHDDMVKELTYEKSMKVDIEVEEK